MALVAVDERLLSGRPVGNCTGCEIEVEAGRRDKDRGASTFFPLYWGSALVAERYLDVYSHKPDDVAWSYVAVFASSVAKNEENGVAGESDDETVNVIYLYFVGCVKSLTKIPSTGCLTATTFSF